jgi:hypothetical protein
MVDLSAKGMLFLSDEPIHVGSKLRVSFQATALAVTFDTPATVTRVVERRRKADGGRALGIRFDSLPVVSRLILRGHLRKLPHSRHLVVPQPTLAPQEEHVDPAAMLQRVMDEALALVQV